MSILINVVNQKMCTHFPLNELVSGSQEFACFEFIFNKDWDELTIFAQFTQNGVAYNKYLDENNRVYLPPEIKEGTCTLMLYGTQDKVIATTNYLTLTINKDIFISNAQSTEITESLYNQLVSKIEALKNIGSGGGLNITDDGNGNVTITPAGNISITDDGQGNVTIL